MQRTLIAVLIAASFWIGACASKKPKEAPPPPPAEATTGVDANGANSANAGAANGSDDETAGPQAGLLAKRTIYFDFDNSEIKGEGTDIVAAHAKYLAAHSTARVRLEGNTDERGSREYNIGLGAKRAQNVRNFLAQNGINASRIRTVSYGKERPVAVCNDISCWSQNRRAQTVLNSRGEARS